MQTGVEKNRSDAGYLQTPFIPGYSAGCSLKVRAAHPCQKHASPETGTRMPRPDQKNDKYCTVREKQNPRNRITCLSK
ncbi:hypothetical protein CAY57_03495 [Heyndrickxia coagulans]|nr:hypothetical protein CAY57_03495 [Heyndrickxia coagulans]